MQINETCDFLANTFVCTVMTDLHARICWKLIYMYVLWWCMSEVIDFKKKYYWYSCKFMQLAIFCIYICAHGFDWSTKYIMSIIVSNCHHCDKLQFQTLSCVHYTIFSVIKLDLFIRALLLDRILALEKNYAYVSRTSCWSLKWATWKCSELLKILHYLCSNYNTWSYLTNRIYYSICCIDVSKCVRFTFPLT